jgi:hypothetical protein
MRRPLVTLPAVTVHDARLSLGARVVLAIGLCYPPGELPTPVHPFFRRHGIPGRRIEVVLQELEEAGYLSRMRVATATGRRGGSRRRYEFRARPAAPIHSPVAAAS